MKRDLRSAGVSALLLALLIGVGCTPTPTNTNTATNANTAPTAAPPASRPTAGSPASMPVTLPVLDAFFADESFSNELKTRLQLTDEQISKLRQIAREETAKLRENGDDQNRGTTSAAREQALQKVNATIGEQKAEQLMAFLNERGAGAGGGPLATTPGAVPTDSRIVVNAPAFRMDLFSSGQLVKSYKVGIGYPEFPLPAGLRRAETIIFNPTWTPPDEPWVESPGSKVKVGETVPAGDKLNPLGIAKIPIGQPSLIHGGKAPAKLGTFASHGCVGLTNDQMRALSIQIAQLGGADLSLDQIKEFEKNKTETKNVRLSRPVPVELRYETITVEAGKLHIYRDVYDRNTNTEENLRNVLQAYGVRLEQLSEGERAQVMDGLARMSTDVTKTPTSNPPADANKNQAKPNKNSSARVTPTIKGEKVIVLQIAALSGKGYPAPVDLDTGTPPKKQPAAPKKKS